MSGAVVGLVSGVMLGAVLPGMSNVVLRGVSCGSRGGIGCSVRCDARWMPGARSGVVLGMVSGVVLISAVLGGVSDAAVGAVTAVRPWTVQSPHLR